jgi:predicted HicB family RNase H-like nuclease
MTHHNAAVQYAEDVSFEGRSSGSIGGSSPSGSYSSESFAPRVFDPNSPDFTQSARSVYQAASDIYHKAADWVTFFREVLGVDGIVRRSYPMPEMLASFEQTKEYEEIQLMLAKLREKSATKPGNGETCEFEPTRVITVRLPKSLHETLKREAHEKRTSMNKLCISKLLQYIDGELVPAEP